MFEFYRKLLEGKMASVGKMLNYTEINSGNPTFYLKMSLETIDSEAD